MIRGPIIEPAQRRVLLLAAVVLVAAGVIAAGFAGRADELDAAKQLVADEDRFAAASTAGEALTSVSVHLQRAGERCDDDCERLFTAAAIARTSAVVALRCKRPQLFELRLEFVDYLDELDAGEAPRPPFPPAC